MRITHSMLAKTTLRNLNINTERLDRLQTQLTSGHRINTPSDDPIGAAAAVQFRATIDELDQYVKNVDSATSWLEATDSALDSVTSLLHRARELAVQGANGTLSSADRLAIANEVQQLLEQSVATGNATYAGQYVFGGHIVASAPFALVSGAPSTVTYNGNSGDIRRQLDSLSTVIVNIPGDAALSGVFSALIGLKGDLESGSSSAVSSRIADLDSAIESVVSARSRVGARTNRLANQKERLESLKVNISDLLSKTQDVDMTEAITQFATQQNVYQAALAAGAKAIQPNLLDYLR